VKVRRWVSFHGVALNVDPDMRYFQHIVPCGISDRPVAAGAHPLVSPLPS
jgi:lipoyl(octanoyl) transferase